MKSERDYISKKKELGIVDLTLATVKEDFIDKKTLSIHYK